MISIGVFLSGSGKLYQGERPDSRLVGKVHPDA
jgi:hypothetical protein